jgi:nitroimidazol reductase NimA-like FMN-containing flavoprotein (pyridoxamine 5'-phosphate oxidase superfamily)
MHTPDATFSELEHREANQLLARNHVGRLAYTFHDRVDIEPISYVFADGAIFMRTSAGSKVSMLAHSPWVAFEVDEVTSPLDWQSVVVHGTVYALYERGSSLERRSYEDGVAHLRQLVPEAFTERDPTPHRTVVLKLHIAAITGRTARVDR